MWKSDLKKEIIIIIIMIILIIIIIIIITIIILGSNETPNDVSMVHRRDLLVVPFHHFTQ